MTSPNPPITIIICCRDNEDTMAAACATCTWADELIVVDSGSKDRTVEIAKQFTDRVVIEPWRGHSAQKRFAADLARNDWIFFVDSDEEVTPELIAEVQGWDQAYLDRWDLIHVPRRNWIMGREVRAWRPDFVTRIFHRRRVTWNQHVLHDAREPSDPSRVTYCKHDLLHKRVSTEGFSGYFSGKRLDGRLLPVAQQMYDRGNRCRWWDLLVRPWAAFLKFYFVKRGFLDGTFGLMIAQKAAISVQLKYAALWAIQNNPELRQDDHSIAT